MSNKQSRCPRETSSHHEERAKRRKAGASLAIITIVLLVILEAWAYYVIKTIRPDFLTYQHFKVLLELPMVLFFYKGHKWALLFFRGGFALSAPLAIIVCVLLIHKDSYLSIVSTALIPITMTIAGLWILFASEDFMLHFKHERHLRSILLF